MLMILLLMTVCTVYFYWSIKNRDKSPKFRWLTPWRTVIVENLGKKFPGNLWNSKVHYHFRKILTFFPILSQIKPVYGPHLVFLKISLVPYTCHMTYPSRFSSYFNSPNNFRWEVQIMKQNEVGCAWRYTGRGAGSYFGKRSTFTAGASVQITHLHKQKTVNAQLMSICVQTRLLTAQKGPQGKQMYSSTLSLTSAIKL